MSNRLISKPISSNNNINNEVFYSLDQLRQEIYSYQLLLRQAILDQHPKLNEWLKQYHTLLDYFEYLENNACSDIDVVKIEERT